MVADTVAFFVSHGRRVFLDCEHFFDGYAHDKDYGVQVLETAFAAGAEVGVMCDTNGGMLPMGVGRVVADVRARVSGKLGHPLPGRHRLRGRQLPGRRRGRRHPRAGHRERLRRAGRERRHLLPDRQPRDQDGPARGAGGVPAGAAAGQSRDRGAGQHRPRRPPALRRRLGVRPQGRAARQRDQGQPRALQPPRPRRRRQRHAHPGHRDGRPGLDRAEGPRARRRPRRAGRRDRPRRGPGEGARGRRLVLRGRGRVLRAAAARASCPTPRTRCSSWRATRPPSSTGATASWSARRPSRCTSRTRTATASGSSARPRATARSTPWTTRCGRPW